MKPEDEMAGARLSEYTPEAIREVTEVLAPQAGNYTNAIANQIGRAQESIGPLAAATMGESRTANLGNYTYNRLLRPQVDAMRDDILVQGYTDALNKMLSDSLNAARSSYASGGSGSNSSNSSNGWSGEIGDGKASGDNGLLWKKANIGKDQATYGLYVLKRPAGLSEEEWVEYATNWAREKSYSAGPQGGPGMPTN